MGTITLKNLRVGADVEMNSTLEDGGVLIDWSTLTNIKAWLLSDAQKSLAGRCDVSVDPSDATKLICLYSANKSQYLGINRLVIQATYMGETKTFDKPAFNFVRWTGDQAGEQITIDDPDVDVAIAVTDVSSSILQNAIAAAIQAAEDAEHAAHLIPNQVLLDCEAATAVALTAASHAPQIGENGNWWVWNSEQEAYVDTGNVARGPRGNGITSWSVVESQEDDGNNVITVTFTDGEEETFTVKNGKTGNGIASIVQTTESHDDAGTNVITITMTNGAVVTFNVKNGSKGQPGAAQAAYKSVAELPTASAATMDKIYLTPSGTSGVYNMSYTDYDGTNYSWVDLGTTAIQLSDYATKAQVDQLDLKVGEINGLSRIPVNIDGNNNTLVAKRLYGLKSGFKYRISILNPDVPVSNIPASNSLRFSVGYKPNGGSLVETTGIKCDSLSTPLANYYDMTIPDGIDVQFVLFQIRCNSGSTLQMYLYEIDVATESYVARKVDEKSKILSFVGNGNTYSYGNPNGGFVPNQIYRIFIPVTDWDMSGVTSTGDKFNIQAYNNKDCSTSAASEVGISILNRTIGGSSVPSVYDVYLPSTVNKNGTDITVREWFIRISGRAANGVTVNAICELHNELVNTAITQSYSYSSTGSKENKKQYYNFQKGHIYQIVFDTTGLGNSSINFNIYQNGVSIKDFGASWTAGVVTFTYIPDQDYFGCYLRFYIGSSAGYGSFTSSIRDISIEKLSDNINVLSGNIGRMNLVSIFSTDLKVGTLYSNSVDNFQTKLRYTPQYFEVMPNSSLAFQYKERADGKEVRVRVQFVTSNKTFISPNDDFTHLTSKKVPSTAAYCRFVFGLYENGSLVDYNIDNAEIAIQIPGRTIIIDEAVKELDENVLIKKKQELTDNQINNVRQNLQLGGELSVSFNKTTSSHTSTQNQLNISVKKGRVLKFGLFTEISEPSISGQFYGYDKDGNSLDFGGVSAANKWRFIECREDIEYIGVYLSADTTSGTYTIKAIGGVADDPQKNGVDIISINRGAIERIIAARSQAYSSPTDFGNYSKDGYNRLPAFLQITDTHANFTCMERAMEFADNSGLISQVLHSGDIIESSNAAGRKETEWAKLLNDYNKPILAIPGNHEFSANPPYTDAEIHSWLYNSTYQTRNGEIHPTINGDEKNYWHKDIICPDYYDDGVLKTGKKIRIIGTYDFEFPDSEVGGVTGRKDKCWYTQDQIDWFVSKLDETLSSDFLGVLILSHYVLSKSKYLDTDFVPDSRRGIVSDGDIMASNIIINSNQYFFGQILNAFVNGGSVNTSVTLEMADTDVSTTLVCEHTFASAGKFIANICGHKHAGGMLQMVTDGTTVNEKLRVVLSPCSTNNDHQNTKWWGRSSYNSNVSFPNNVDCLNVIVYDHIRDKVKVVRVGSNINNNLKECNAFVF